MKKLLTFILVLVAVLSVSSVALAEEKTVTYDPTKTPFENGNILSAAFKAAADGDKIIIGEGTYAFDDDYDARIWDKGLTLVGAGEDKTIINSYKYGFVLQGHPSKRITYNIENMTINSGCITGWGQPIYVKGNTEVNLKNVTLHNAGTTTTAILVDSANENSAGVYENGITATVNATNVTVDPDDKILLYANPSNLTTAVSGKAEFNYSNCTNILDNNIEGQEDYNKGVDNLLVNNESINPAVAQIGTTKYATLQAAIHAAQGMTDEVVTIKILSDNAETVHVLQKEGPNLVIDGAKTANEKYKMTGQIKIFGNSRHTGAETLTIQNIAFEKATGDAIWGDGVDKKVAVGCAACDGKDMDYPHNVTIQNCTFTGDSIVGVRIRQGYNISIKDCEMNGGHSLFQCINCTGATIENTEVYDASEGGVNINNSTGVTVSGCTFECGLYGVRGGAEGGADGDVTIKGTSIKAKNPIIMRYQTKKDEYTLNIKDEGNALTPDWDKTTAPTYDEKAPIYVTEKKMGDYGDYNNENLNQVGGIVAWNENTNTYYTGTDKAIKDAGDNDYVYPVVNGDVDRNNPLKKPTPSAPPSSEPTTKPSTGSGISVKYNGGNSFSTSNPAVPTGVEIDGVPVTFNGNGSNFTVGCISSDAKWVTVRWNSTTVTTNFTPDGLVECTTVSIPKTGDMPFWAAVAAFFGF